MRAQPRSVLAALLLTAALASACGDEEGEGGAGGTGGGPTGPLSLKLVTYNIGNADDAEPHYPLRISYQPYEDHVGAKLRALEPDVVLLQEVLPPESCGLFEEADPGRTCFDAANRQPAAQRILGPEYTVVCDGRQHVECIGVKRSFGTIEGIEPGSFVLDGAETPPLPLAPCVWADGECDNTKCDAESTVSAVTIATANGPLRMVHAHPNAAGSGASGPYLGDGCRSLQLEQIFTGLPGDGGGPLVTAAPTIVAGDWNLDPDRIATPDERAWWAATIGDGLRFRDLSARDPATRETFPTNNNSVGVAIDRVVADVVTGRCEVRGTHPFVGPAAGTEPLDSGFDFSLLPGGETSIARNDHYAVVCDLRLPVP